MTNCSVKGVLEVAHVKPHCASKLENKTENKAENGILLRADLHILFDLHLIIIHPHTKIIEVKESLHNSIYYRKLNNKTLLAYQQNLFVPNVWYLEWRHQNYEGFLSRF